MKFDKQKAFPYPVLRPNSDDYLSSEFQVSPIFDIDQNVKEIGVKITYSISSNKIVDEIGKCHAEYISIISCRDTYYQLVLKSESNIVETKIKVDYLRGEVKVESYVVVRKDVQLVDNDINPEFGAGPFHFTKGDVLAQDEAQIFYFDRDLFKPITSVFDLVILESLNDEEWRIGYSDDHIKIQVSPKMKGKIDSARNDPVKKAILMNSLYFAAVMQAIQKLKDTDQNEEFAEFKWAQVIKHSIHNKEGCDLITTDSYLLAERLMKFPFGLLKYYLFKGEE